MKNQQNNNPFATGIIYNLEIFSPAVKMQNLQSFSCFAIAKYLACKHIIFAYTNKKMKN
jgi:hypothetical protein